MDKEPNSELPESEAKPSDIGSVIARFWAELKRRKVMRVAITYIIVAWAVIQVAVNTFPSLLIPGWALSFVVMCVILGFPVALVLAWAFELTPDGIKKNKVARQENVGTEESETQSKKRNWLAIGFAAALPTFIFGSLALVFYIRLGGDFEADKSIAVLPFDNRSNLEEDLFFTDGIHDELLTQISKISDIRTVSRTSVEVYRDSPKNMRTIGEELEVGVILEGGVQRVGDQVRINVQLIDAATDAHLWADIYNREMSVENLLDIQTEIAVAIAGKLKAVISPEEQKRIEKLPTDSMDALEAYFKGREIVELEVVTRRPEAIALLEEAIAIDPEFSLAYEWLARAKFFIAPRELRAEAETAVKHALELDPQLDSSEAFLGGILAWRREVEAARKAYERALAINSNNAEAFLGQANLDEREMDVRDPESVQRALRNLEQAISLDPQNLRYRSRLGYLLQQLGRFSQAQELFEKAVELQPDAPFAHQELGRFHAFCLGQFDQAILHQRKVMALDPERLLNYQMLFEYYIQLDDQDEILRWVDVIANYFEGGWSDEYKDIYLRFAYPEEEEKWIESQRKMVRDHPSWPARRGLLHTNLNNGRIKEARAFYEEYYPSLFAETLNLYDEPGLRQTQRMDRAKAAVEMAEIERRSGNLDRSALLADAAWDYWRHFPRMGWRWNGGTGFGVFDAMVHAIKGEKKQALDSIREAVEAGFRNRFEFKFPWFDSLRDEPEFVELMEIVDKDVAEQLANVRRMEASGELPAIPEAIREFMEKEPVNL